MQLKLLGAGTQMSNPFLSVPDSESLRRESDLCEVGTYWASLAGSQIDKCLSTILGWKFWLLLPSAPADKAGKPTLETCVPLN